MAQVAVPEKNLMTGGELARRLGCHHTTVSRWRNGHRLPGVALLNELSTVTGIPYPEILTAWQSGAKNFGHFLRTEVLDEEI
jgi:transcriptional regulator with XRE-family HTH domain